mmetsp:Transcript_70522/g.162979  ORF Transcript_70522/g.162979 Transcript_70522/m.162979 type:complete len:222 (-) Transcript_70522:1587-2252(-)
MPWESLVLQAEASRQTTNWYGGQTLDTSLRCIGGESEAWDGTQDSPVVQQDDVHVRSKEGGKHLQDVATRKEKGKLRYGCVEQNVRVARQVHRAEIAEAHFGIEPSHLSMGTHKKFHDVAWQPDGHDRFKQEGDQETGGEGIPEEKVSQGPLHRVGLEDLQHRQLLQRLAIRSAGIPPHHHRVRGVRRHGQIHSQVHKHCQEVEDQVCHLCCLLNFELGHL